MKPTIIIFWCLTLCAPCMRAGDSVGSIYGAIQRENVEMVRTALSADTNAVNFVGEKRFTLLHFAAEHNFSNGIQILEMLLAKGAKIDARNHIHQTPLFSAVIYDNVPGTKVLLAHGAEVNARQDGGMTPLHCAARNGYCQVARVLIENKAAIKARTEAGETPVALALEELKDYRKEGNASMITRYEQMVSLLRKSEQKDDPPD